MPETRLFETRCKGCGRILVTVERLRDPEVAILTEHLRSCRASQPFGDAPIMLGAIMDRVRVIAVNRRTETSPCGDD